MHFRESCIVDLADSVFHVARTPLPTDRKRMRSFPFRHQARLLAISVVAVDEGWELWVSEDDRRLAYGGRVSIDQAIAGWRVGDDRVQELAEEVKSNVLTGKLALDTPAAVEPAASAHPLGTS
jgi:hypothetical protein